MTKTPSKKVFIHSKYVCERAKTDARKIAVYLQKNGYTIVNNPAQADLIIFNSCGYSNPIAQQCLKEIQKYKRYTAELVVIGGLPESDKKEYETIFTGKTISHKDLKKIDMFFPQHTIKFNEIQDCNISWLTIDNTTVSGALKKIATQTPLTKKIYTKFFDYTFKLTLGKHYMILSNPLDIPTDDIYRIEIARGCSFHCSYCAIRKSIGPFHSKPFQSCIDEFEHGLNKGSTTFYITAPDPGCYGTDIDTTYPILLDKLTSYHHEYSIGLDGLNPVWLVKYISDLENIVRRGKIKVISIPIQSGSKRILTLMKRFSHIEKISEAVQRIKTAYPPITLSTAGIVGFPSETDEEFKETIQAIITMDFDLGFINPISIKPDTPAECVEPKITPSDMRKRIVYAKTYLRHHRYNTFSTKTGGVVFGKKQ
ncbi:MAG: radical SAM protein [Methanobacteriota archaeon]